MIITGIDIVILISLIFVLIVTIYSLNTHRNVIESCNRMVKNQKSVKAQFTALYEMHRFNTDAVGILLGEVYDKVDRETQIKISELVKKYESYQEEKSTT